MLRYSYCDAPCPAEVLALWALKGGSKGVRAVMLCRLLLRNTVYLCRDVPLSHWCSYYPTTERHGLATRLYTWYTKGGRTVHEGSRTCSSHSGRCIVTISALQKAVAVPYAAMSSWQRAAAVAPSLQRAAAVASLQGAAAVVPLCCGISAEGGCCAACSAADEVTSYQAVPHHCDCHHCCFLE